MAFYAVIDGTYKAIYNTWKECKFHTHRISNVKYKKFDTEELAQEWLDNNGITKVAKVVKESPKSTRIISADILEAWVDGSNNPKTMQYGCGVIITYRGKVVQIICQQGKNDPEAQAMRNVSGELLGSILAIKWAIEHRYNSIKIYHDYEGIAKWANHQWKAKNKFTKWYVDFVDKYRAIISIEFEKVDAYTGVELNEQAVRLAKEAVGVYR